MNGWCLHHQINSSPTPKGQWCAILAICTDITITLIFVAFYKLKIAFLYLTTFDFNNSPARGARDMSPLVTHKAEAQRGKCLAQHRQGWEGLCQLLFSLLNCDGSHASPWGGAGCTQVWGPGQSPLRLCHRSLWVCSFLFILHRNSAFQFGIFSHLALLIVGQNDNWDERMLNKGWASTEGFPFSPVISSFLTIRGAARECRVSTRLQSWLNQKDAFPLDKSPEEELLGIK